MFSYLQSHNEHRICEKFYYTVEPKITMTSVIVVDNELKDSILEYGHILDGVNGNTDFSGELKLHIDQDSSDIKDKTQLITKIFKHTTTESLKKLSDKEFEATYNLLIHILTNISDSKSIFDDLDSELYKTLIEINPKEQPSLKDRRSLKSTTVLSVFNTIFNLLPETSSTRVFILSQILNIIEVSNFDFKLIEQNLGNDLIQWLVKAKATREQIKTIFWKFISLNKKIDSVSLNYIRQYTFEFELDTEELHHLIKFALISEVVDVSFLVNNNVAKAIKQNENDKLASLFNKYVHGELITLSNELGNDIDVEFVESKSKILNLAKFFNDNLDTLVFNFKDIPTYNANPKEFELLVVEAIKAGVIEGKVNQLEQKFYLIRVNRFVLAGEDNSKNWNDVKEVLLSWKNSLSDIEDIVNTARESIVNAPIKESEDEGEHDDDV